MKVTKLMTWIVFILPLAMGLFYVKHVVENLEEEIYALESQIHSDQDEIHVLKAEWIYLSRPDRVKKLASQYLDLQPTNSTQIADISAIPMSGEAVVVSSNFNIESY
jgi:cell division protein FtsL